MRRIAALLQVALAALMLSVAACAEIRRNERPPINPEFSPSNQPGNRA
jgi:hypothetical protein